MFVNYFALDDKELFESVKALKDRLTPAAERSHGYVRQWAGIIDLLFVMLNLYIVVSAQCVDRSAYHVEGLLLQCVPGVAIAAQVPLLFMPILLYLSLLLA